MILRRVNLPGVSYCAEPIPRYHASHLLKFVLKSPRGRGMIPRGVSFFATNNRISQRKPNRIRIENILTFWSVAQIDSN